MAAHVASKTLKTVEYWVLTLNLETRYVYVSVALSFCLYNTWFWPGYIILARRACFVYLVPNGILFYTQVMPPFTISPRLSYFIYLANSSGVYQIYLNASMTASSSFAVIRKDDLNE